MHKTKMGQKLNFPFFSLIGNSIRYCWRLLGCCMCFFLWFYFVVFQTKWMLSICVMMLKKIAVLLSAWKTTSRKYCCSHNPKIYINAFDTISVYQPSRSIQFHPPTHVQVILIVFDFITAQTTTIIIAPKCCNTTEFGLFCLSNPTEQMNWYWFIA